MSEPNEKKAIKIGQIGIGHNHAGAKMETVRKFPELFRVVGYAETDENWIKERGGLDAYQGLIRMSADEIIEKSDAVLVECDVWNLTKYAKKCVNAGKHIHMDKPASGTLEEFKTVLDTAKAKNLTVQMGYMYRYNPAVQKCLRLIQDGELGEVYSINAEMSTFHDKPYKEWLTNFRGGIMYILGSHMVDLIVHILGEPKKITPFLKHSGLDGVDLEDNNLAVLEYDKALARVFISSVEVNGFGRRQFVAAGSKGTASIYPMEDPCSMTFSSTEIATQTYADMKERVQLPPPEGRYDQMMKDFYDYAVGAKRNPYTYAHDYLVQKVLYEIIGGKACG